MKQKTKNKNWFDYTFLIVFSAIVYISILVWLKLDTNLPHWDMGRHLYITTIYKELWLRVPQSFLHLGSVFLSYYYYPPAVHNAGLLFESIFGFNADIAVASNIVWLLMITFSVYFLVKQLFGRWAAVASLLFLFASPMLIGQSREFQVDLPMTAVFSLSLLLLYKTEKFSNTKYSILFGLVVGLGMMTKWTFAAFIVPAGLLFVILGIIDKKINKNILIKNIILALLFSFIICGPWYFHNRHQLRNDFTQNGINQAAVEGDPYGFNKIAFLWYLRALAGNYLFLPLSVFAILGIIYSIIRKNWIPVVLLVLFYLIISSLPNKDTRYIMPVIVLIAILGSSFVAAFNNKIFKVTSVVVLSLIFITNTAVVAFGKYLPFKNKDIKINNSPYGIIIGHDGYTTDSPKEEVCPMKNIIFIIPEGSSARLIGQSKIDFSDWAVAYFLSKNGRIWVGQTDDISGAQYLIYRSSDGLLESQSLVLQQDLLIKYFNCTDGSKVSIYKN